MERKDGEIWEWRHWETKGGMGGKEEQCCNLAGSCYLPGCLLRRWEIRVEQIEQVTKVADIARLIFTILECEKKEHRWGVGQNERLAYANHWMLSSRLWRCSPWRNGACSSGSWCPPEGGSCILTSFCHFCVRKVWRYLGKSLNGRKGLTPWQEILPWEQLLGTVSAHSLHARLTLPKHKSSWCWVCYVPRPRWWRHLPREICWRSSSMRGSGHKLMQSDTSQTFWQCSQAKNKSVANL